MIIYHVVTGERPSRPPGPNEWLSDDVWNFISRCWSSSWDGRPDLNFAMNTLNDVANAAELRRMEVELIALLGASGAGVNGGLEVLKAQAFANRLDEVRHPERLQYQTL